LKIKRAGSSARTADGYYDLERMLAAATRRCAQLGLCGTCIDSRAIREEQI
jgi:sulfur relay (sulfurtransferase) complex TusBCD TusD component (DsrE family)